MHGIDSEGGVPQFEVFIQSIHPEDRAMVLEIIESAARERTEFEVDFRTGLPDGAVIHLHGVGHPVPDESGDAVEFVGTAMDVTERKRAEEEHRAHLSFLESMDQVNPTIQGTNDLEHMMSDVLDAVLAIFHGDRIQLQQVLLNLLMNAIEAMSGGGVGPRALWVSSERVAATEVVIAVGDSGPGFAPQSLDRLFDAFYTTKPHGLGLGLAISRRIIEAHGGRLWATANAPHGAVLQFTVPMESEGVA
jgi:signal transduction histidine kinase